MDLRTPIQIALGVLLAALSIAVIGLAADNIAYAHHNPAVDIQYSRWNKTAEQEFKYHVKMDYKPSSFDLERMYGMVAASVIALLVGTKVAIGSWCMRGRNGFPAKHVLMSSLALSAVSFIISFAVSIWSFQPVMRWVINFAKSLPLPARVSNFSQKVVYRSPFGFTPEVWNCLLAPSVTQPQQARKIRHLCSEANAAKNLMIPVLVLSAAMFVTLLWTWRKATLAAAAGERPQNGKEVEEVSVVSQR